MSAPLLSYAAPGGNHGPIIGDTSVSGIYETYLSEAVLAGKKLDTPSIVDPITGELTDDPAPYIEHPEHRSAPLLGAPVFQRKTVCAQRISGNHDRYSYAWWFHIARKCSTRACIP